jgi:NAD(P)-dependent dehydrogenase (short-subunit alcohol dehydrogenase family)
MNYRGAVAVVTGASSGLGRRLAVDLAREGATVVGIARREDRLQALVTEIGAGSCYRVCDLADPDAFVACLRAVEAEQGRIDILLNVAGIGGIVRTEPPVYSNTRQVFEVNFFSPYAGMLAVLPGMRERRHGAIANMSSDDARAPGPGAGDYSASKAALSAATESLSYEVRGDGVSLHVVYPGWVPTEMGLYAVEHGGMRMPPRATRRTEAQVSRLVLARLGDPRVEINATKLALAAPLMRSVMPRTYHRLRATR